MVQTQLGLLEVKIVEWSIMVLRMDPWFGTLGDDIQINR